MTLEVPFFTRFGSTLEYMHVLTALCCVSLCPMPAPACAWSFQLCKDPGAPSIAPGTRSIL